MDENHVESVEDFNADEMRQALTEAPWGLEYGLDAHKIGQLTRYAEMLAETNKVLNLTAITDIRGILERHFLDCMTLLPYLDREAAKLGDRPLRVADVGTGAGFPGLVLKIMRPAIRLELIDSLNKRIRFLEEVSHDLSLGDVSCRHLRAEDAGRHPELRDSVDFVTARAVAELRILAEYCLPLAGPGAVFAAMKGQAGEEVDAALPAIYKLAGKVESVDRFTLPGTDMARELILIRKTGPTPKAYPRPAGKLQKKPL